MKKEGKSFWSIENWDGHHWEEIPNYLAEALIQFHNETTALEEAK